MLLLIKLKHTHGMIYKVLSCLLHFPFDRCLDAHRDCTVHLYPNCIQCIQFADIDWIGGDYRGDYTDHGSVMRSCPSLAAVPDPLIISSPYRFKIVDFIDVIFWSRSFYEKHRLPIQKLKLINNYQYSEL